MSCDQNWIKVQLQNVIFFHQKEVMSRKFAPGVNGFRGKKGFTTKAIGNSTLEITFKITSKANHLASLPPTSYTTQTITQLSLLVDLNNQNQFNMKYPTQSLMRNTKQFQLATPNAPEQQILPSNILLCSDALETCRKFFIKCNNYYILKTNYKQNTFHILNETSLFFQQKRALTTQTTTTQAPLETSTKINQLAEMSAEKGDLKKAEIFFNQMKHQNITISQKTFEAFIRAYGKIGDHQTVEKCFYEMKNEKNIEISSIHINWLLSTVLTSKNFTKFEEYFQLYEKFSIAPMVSSFNIIFKILTELNEYHLVDVYLKKMIDEYKLEPDIVTFNSLISSCFRPMNCHIDFVKKAEEYFKLMRSFNIIPDQFIYSNLIRIYSNSGNFEPIERICNEMREKNLPFDLTFYHILIQSNIRSNSSEKIEQIYEILKENNQLNDVSFSLFISAAIELNFPKEKIENYFKEMKKLQISKNVQFYNKIIAACIKQKDVQKGIDFLFQMKEEKFQPDIATMTNLIKLSFQNNDLISCDHFLKLTEQMKLPIDLVFLNSAIRFAKNVEYADKILEFLPKFQIKPDIITINSLLQSCVSSGNLEKANYYFSLIKKFNGEYYEGNDVIKAGVITFNTLINCCTVKENIVKAEEYFQEMISANIPPTVITFNTLFLCFRMKGDVKRMDKYYNLMLTRKVKPDLVTFNNIFICICQSFAKSEEKLDGYINEMKRWKISPNYKTLMAFVRFYKKDSPKYSFYSRKLNANECEFYHEF